MGAPQARARPPRVPARAERRVHRRARPATGRTSRPVFDGDDRVGPRLRAGRVRLPAAGRARRAARRHARSPPRCAPTRRSSARSSSASGSSAAGTRAATAARADRRRRDLRRAAAVGAARAASRRDEQARLLVRNIRRFLTGVGAPPEVKGPAKIGSSQSPARDRPGHHRARRSSARGVGSNNAVYVGGAWYAVNGWLTWALGELEGVVPDAPRARARRARAQHARRARDRVPRALGRRDLRRRRVQRALREGPVARAGSTSRAGATTRRSCTSRRGRCSTR